MFFSRLQRYPFLRLVIPLIGGVVCGDACFFSYFCNYSDKVSFWSMSLSFHRLLLFLLVGCLVSHVIAYVLSAKCRLRYLHGITVFACCFVSGMLLSGYNLDLTKFEYTTGKQVYQVIVEGKPTVKERSVCCQVSVNGSFQQRNYTAYPHKTHFLLYFSKDSAALCLQPGDELLVYTCLKPPMSNVNPAGFDYGRYLVRNGISGNAFVASSQWKLTEHTTHRSLLQWATDSRERLINSFHLLGFSGDNYAVLSALTVGYMNDLTTDIKDVYSVTGVSHILSLSGLHIGMLYALLVFLLAPLWRKWSPLKPWLYCFILAVLWIFAFFTGALPPVIRSVVMISVYAISNLLSRRGAVLNTLAATAFAMLVYNPMWLFDVGFQLSFFSIVGIVLIQPYLYSLFNTSKKPERSFYDYCKGILAKKEKFRFKQSLYYLLYYIVGIVTVSIAAQAATAPVVIHYFHRFPTHFLITNLWIIPLTMLILYGSILMLLSGFSPSLQHIMANVVDWLLDFQNETLRSVTHWPFASIDGLWLDACEVILLYLLLILMFRCFIVRTSRSLFLFIVSLLFLSVYQVSDRILNAPTNCIVFYATGNCSGIQCIREDGQSWLACTGSSHPFRHLCPAANSYCGRLHISSPHLLSSDVSTDDISYHNSILMYGGKRICMISDNRWRSKKSAHPLTVDYLYLSKNYRGDIAALEELFRIRTVVLNPGLSEYKSHTIKRECLKLKIPCLDLAEGYAPFIVNL